MIDDARLKEPGGFDYFDELLERIRDIRGIREALYQKVRDVFAATSVDYRQIGSRPHSSSSRRSGTRCCSR